MNLKQAIEKHQGEFGLNLGEETIGALENFHFGVMKNNELLHLVGKCDAEEFAIRHILESLYALQHLPENSHFADIGAGAGLPGIPCLIARSDLKGTLVESKLKKTDFLKKAVQMCGLEKRAEIIGKQFDEAEDPGVSHIMCRAIDGFSKKLPRILSWSKEADLILFAGKNIRDALKKANVDFTEQLIPMSERRFIFNICRSPKAKTETAETPPISLDEDDLLEV